MYKCLLEWAMCGRGLLFMKATIIKSKLHKDFTIVPNEILKRTDVSLQAKGLFCFIQSLPDDWVVYKNKISKMTGESKRQINNSFSELEQKGYLISTEVIRGGLPQKEYVFYQYPYNEYPATSQNDTSIATKSQNELTDAQNELTKSQNGQLLNTKLLNKEIVKTTITTEGLQPINFNDSLKRINKLYKEELLKEENRDLVHSIKQTSNKDFDEEILSNFNKHLFVEKKYHKSFDEYAKHFRNWLGKKKFKK